MKSKDLKRITAPLITAAFLAAGLSVFAPICVFADDANAKPLATESSDSESISEPYARTPDYKSLDPYAKAGQPAKQVEAVSAEAACDHPGSCKLVLLDPHPSCHESECVIETVQSVIQAFLHGDFESVSKYLDDGCTTFDEGTKQLIVGKPAVLADLKRKFQLFAPDSDSPLTSFTIDQPYAKVTGNTAVVTFVAVKTFGGKHPKKLISHSTEVLVKDGNTWKKVHYRSNWKPMS